MANQVGKQAIPGPQPEVSAMIFSCGVLGGVIATVFGVVAAGTSQSAWISAADSATLISGFGGAALGGGISWLLAHQTSRQANEKDERRRLEEEIATASSACLKLLSIANGLFTLRNYIRRERDLHPEATRLHEAIRPITGLIELNSPFLTSDFAAFFRVDKGELANQALLLEPRYRATLAAIRTYNEEHVQFQRMLMPFRRGKDQPMRIEADQATLAEILTRIEILDALITPIVAHVEADFTEAKALCEAWDHALYDLYGKHFLQIADVASNDATE
ncbi:hypothetical protein A6U87_17550 [Rhizobium sp. AC44/96]|uniref:hypothetical protein n=1 Tax=Rhizobium sp. AC44/96 TaxID=1841654 RepID=UPI00080F9D88|nr:hypothetical protein [Rhizobium sp. AC44/96]OCJ03740.1 hypothetical protein A6U87_17550 [Rhizobium sp. AC44/96]